MNKVDTIESDMELLWRVNIADVEALEDAKYTLNVIKEVEPGTFDEIIDSALVLINKALKVGHHHDAMERVEEFIRNEAKKDKIKLGDVVGGMKLIDVGGGFRWVKCEKLE